MKVLFDIGGTKTRIALTESTDSFEDAIIYPTPEDYNQALNTFKTKVLEVLGDRQVSSLIGGVPASFNPEHTALVSGGPQIATWLNRTIIDDFSQLFGTPVHMANDAMMGGLAQAHFGPGKGYEIVVYLTVSTGVGGARIINGKIDANRHGFEPGFQIIDAESKSSEGKYNNRHLMSYIGGDFIEDTMGTKAENITDPVFWESAARILSVGINNACLFWSPDIVIVGGSIINDTTGISLELVRQKLSDSIQGLAAPPPIEHAVFGDEMGLWGALAYANAYGVE
jgi:predicted NBD/HSP70 family sugar kinase